jgi:predicted hotdog family 3-hydroxylacyl-ACP dehydratase
MLQPGNSYTLRDVLPHGPGMLLLDRLVGYEAESVTCEVLIRPESLFCRDARGVPSYVGIEYMAQALGAFTGIARLQKGRAVQIEMLLGTRAYDATRAWFAPGSRLTVRTDLLYWDPEGVCAFDCTLHDGAERVARAEIKGYEPEDIGPFLAELAKEPL